jgi:DNA-binding transcriptional ArsR family regulator
MQPITSIATSLLNFGIFALLVRYWSSVDDFPLNKSIEVTLRMQAVLLNKSIGARLLNLLITSDHTPGDLESVRERLNVVTQETRFSLLQDILGHPSELPTLKELDYVNPSKSQTTIRQHLQPLVNVGIVEEVLLPEDRRQNDLPYKFYGISESGRQFLEEHKLLRAQDTVREIYDRVKKTDDIIRYETAPRPEG